MIYQCEQGQVRQVGNWVIQIVWYNLIGYFWTISHVQGCQKNVQNVHSNISYWDGGQISIYASPGVIGQWSWV